jgi:hypothetical protein
MANDQNRLREALDQIANALQPAVVVSGQLQQSSEATARDASVIQAALTRAVAILRAVQGQRPE